MQLFGLNLLDSSFGLWNRAFISGFKWVRKVLMTWTGHLADPGCEKIFPSEWSSVPSRPPVWFLLVRTVLLFSSKYYPSGLFIKRSMDFFIADWFSLPLFPKYNDIKNHDVWRTLGSCVVASPSCPFSYRVWINSPVSGLL